MIIRDTKLERTILKQRHRRGDKYSSAFSTFWSLSLQDKYVEGIATIRFRPEKSTDTFATQIVQMEHAWCITKEGLVVDTFWHDDPMGMVDYFPIVESEDLPDWEEFRPLMNKQLLNKPKNFVLMLAQARKEALENFKEYDENERMIEWKKKIGKTN